MKNIDFLEQYQSKTQRNYLERVCEHDKAKCAAKATQWGEDYWDGDRQYGYGGYHYDGRWKSIAQDFVDHYQIKPGQRVLDIGCGKGFFLYELTQLVDGLEIVGLDISTYALEHAKPEIKDKLQIGNAIELPWPDDFFDFVYSNGTLHNLEIQDLSKAIREIERVGKQKWIGVESYRNLDEKTNLLYWQLTCEAFLSIDGWKWLLEQQGYTGDYGFIFFE